MESALAFGQHATPFACHRIHLVHWLKVYFEWTHVVRLLGVKSRQTRIRLIGPR